MATHVATHGPGGNLMDDQLIRQRIYEEAMERFVTPEIEKRKADGCWPEGTALWRFQILMWGLPDPAPRAEVRLNDEVRTVAKVRVTEDIQAGDPVTFDRISEVVEIRPLEEGDDVNAAHVTALHRDGRECGLDTTFNTTAGDRASIWILPPSTLPPPSGCLRPATSDRLQRTASAD